MEVRCIGSLESLSTLTEEIAEKNNRSSYIMTENPESQPPSSGYTFADLGIPTNEHVQNTLLGKSRGWKDVSWNEWIYMALMLVSILLASGFTLYRLVSVGENEPDFTFCLVLLWNAAFCLWFVIDGVLRERPSEIFILTVATVIITCYLIVNYIAGAQNDIKLSRLLAACVISPILFLIGLKIAWTYHISKRLIFRIVGANEHLQTLYRNLLTFQDFLKFDLQLGGSMIIFILHSRGEISLKEEIILSIGGAVTIAWFFLGYFTMPRENKVLAVIFFIFSPAEIAYICYKMYDVSNLLSGDNSKGLAGATIACGVIALVVRVLVIIGAALVTKDFGKGLKEKLLS
ncbi:hypothetical protein Btru_051501 [Bulinus truncatus]|nr:hypothetical protein Btru_051501 [Bulinus truncatus]